MASGCGFLETQQIVNKFSSMRHQAIAEVGCRTIVDKTVRLFATSFSAAMKIKKPARV